jgi:hypothetical protein
MTISRRASPSILMAALAALSVASLAGCAKPPPESTASEPSPPPAADVTPATETQSQAEADAAAREAELKAKELEMELRERELADREAALAATKKSSRPSAAAPRPVASTPKAAASAPAAAAAAPPPPPVTVPAGAQVSVRLNSDYSTKTNAVGEEVNAVLASDLVVDGRVVARAGAPISGTMTEVTSGSRKIGAVPALKIDFTRLVVADGTTLPVAIRINQKGQSEKGRDTAKIAGGTAAGAIIGHQIDDDKGKVIGGVIGGAAGAIGAHKTGTEVELAAGTILAANVRTAFTYDGR